MKVSVWFASSLSDRYITGVGKHALNMIGGLNQLSDVEAELLLMKGTGSPHPSAAALMGISRKFLGGRRMLALLWLVFGWPSIAHWFPAASWVYCPRELWIPPGRARLAVTVHDLWPLDGSGFSWTTRLKWKWVLGKALRRADLVLVVSNFTSSRVQSHFGIDPKKIRVVGNGASDEYFGGQFIDASTVIPQLAGCSFGVAVGGLTFKKGGDRILALADRLFVIRPEIRLVVVGPIDPEFKSRAWPSNLVCVARGLADSELAALVSSAIFACSLSRYEGFGITVAEAMAAGTPVIASDIPAHREVAGDAALLVDGEDNAKVIAGVLRLLDEPELVADLRFRGAEQAKMHTWRTAVDRLHRALMDFSA